MTDNIRMSGWAGPVTEFIKRNLPASDQDGAWTHDHITAYQIGCEALRALGHATLTDRGARPLADPHLPQVMSRWNDMCVAVLALADQQGLITYLPPEGVAVPAVTVRRVCEEKDVLTPLVIKSGYGLGPARVDQDLLPVLQSLGLVENGRWMAKAETILWREQPQERALEVTTDPRFTAAVDRACTVIPEDVRAELTNLATITEEKVASLLKSRLSRHDTLEAYPDGKPVRPPTRKVIREGLIRQRRHDLDWLFFERWRLSDDWLAPDERDRALSIFHDPLAIQMRCAVVAKLFPEEPALALTLTGRAP